MRHVLGIAALRLEGAVGALVVAIAAVHRRHLGRLLLALDARARAPLLRRRRRRLRQAGRLQRRLAPAVVAARPHALRRQPHQIVAQPLRHLLSNVTIEMLLFFKYFYKLFQQVQQVRLSLSKLVNFFYFVLKILKYIQINIKNRSNVYRN